MLTLDSRFVACVQGISVVVLTGPVLFLPWLVNTNRTGIPTLNVKCAWKVRGSCKLVILPKVLYISVETRG